MRIRALADTISYYEENAQEYFESTVNADMNVLRERFLIHVKDGGRILDVGCGSGRDLKAFSENGYLAEGIDGSAELCKLASTYAGCSVQCVRFEDWKADGKYDGIWACASLLHLKMEEILRFIARADEALNNQGAIFLSFKRGIETGVDDKGRYNTNCSEALICKLHEMGPDLTVVDEWDSDDRTGRDGIRWINMILKHTTD